MSENVFAEPATKQIVFNLRTGHIKRDLSAVCIIPFLRNAAKLIDQHSEVIQKIVEKVETQFDTTLGADIEQLGAKRTELFERWKNIESSVEDDAGEEKHAGEIAEISKALAENTVLTDKLRKACFTEKVKLYLQEGVSASEILVIDVLGLIFQDPGFRNEFADSLTIPKIREIYEAFMAVNDIKYLLSNPLAQKLQKAVQNLVSGE